MWLSFRMLASTSRCYARNSCLRYFLSTRFTDAFTPARPCSHQQPITKETAEKNSKTDKTSPTSDESSTETKTEQVPVYLKNKPVKAQTQNNQDISKAAGAELVKPGHAQLMEFISLPIEKRYVAKGLFVNKVDLEMLIYPEFHDTDDVLVLEDFCNKVKKLMKNHVDSRQIDIDHELPSVALEKLAHVGVFGAQIPRTYGGLGLNNKEYCALYEILSADFSVLTHWQVSHDLVARTINLFGTEEQKQKYLPGLASGQLKGAFCVHEEDSGQDLCATTTEGQVSEVIDDKIFVSGTKTWVTNGRDADVLIVLAKIRDHGSLEALSEIGTTALIVDRRKHDDKIKILNRRNTSGLRGLNVVDLEFDRIGVTRADILGEMRGGFKVANEAIRHRYAFGVAASAFVKRHIEALQKYTNKTERFDRVLCELTAIKKRFSNMSINAYVLDSMVYYVAGVKDEEPSRDFELEGAMILWFARQALRETLISMEQIQGARSADIESGFERHMRDLSTLNTFMVSDDFLNNFIAMEGLATFAQENKEICEKAANQFEHPMFRLGNSWKFSSSLNYRPKFQHFINEHFHPSLEKASRNVEESMVKLEDVMKTIVSKYGQEIEDDQFVLDRLAEISTLLFASICCLSRSSRSYSIGLRNSDLEMFVAHTFCGIVHWRILRLLTELLHVNMPVLPQVMEVRGIPRISIYVLVGLRILKLRTALVMVHVEMGVLITTDPAMKMFLLYLNDNGILGSKFIISDLDETHVFVDKDIVPILKEKVDELMESMNPDMSEQTK